MAYKDRDINTRDLSEDYLKSVSESELKDRAYTPFEIDNSDRKSIEEIKKCIRLKKYKDKDTIKDSMDYIENLSNKMNVAINNEKKENKTTWELEADLNDLRKVFEQLNEILSQIESGEVNTSISDSTNKKKPKLHMKK